MASPHTYYGSCKSVFICKIGWFLPIYELPCDQRRLKTAEIGKVSDSVSFVDWGVAQLLLTPEMFLICDATYVIFEMTDSINVTF